MEKDSKDIANVTEIVRFPGFELNEDEAKAFNLVTTIDGNTRSYHGAQTDDASNGLWFQEWESLAHHVAFQNSAVYPSLIASVPKFAKNAPEVLHVQLQPYPATTAFEAPLTEVFLATLNAGVSKDEFEAALSAAFEGLPESGVSNAYFGALFENERKYAVVRGFDSREKVMDARARERIGEAFSKLRELAEFDAQLYTLSNK